MRRRDESCALAELKIKNEKESKEKGEGESVNSDLIGVERKEEKKETPKTTKKAAKTKEIAK